MTVAVDRRQVLDHRIAAQGLHRDTAEVTALGVLDLGVQDTASASARLALAARLPDPPPNPLAGPPDPPAHQPTDPPADPSADPSLTLLWSVRGAPHLHRTADLAALARALWPVSDEDAVGRLGAERAALSDAGIGGLDAFTTAAEALRAVVTEPTVKGEVSAAVTRRLPDAYAFPCPSCRATHVYGGLLQQVGVFAGVRLAPGRIPAVLAPIADRPPVPTAPAGTGELIRAYLRLLGPATLGEAAALLGSSPTALRPVWPAGLVEVAVEGRPAWLPEEHLDALRAAAPAPDLVRLLPPADPFLQARDRGLLVPDRERQKALWRAVGSPGAVLAGGEVSGVWRARKAGAARLDLTVQPFGRLSAGARRALDAEAARVAAARGLRDVRVAYEPA